MIVLNSTLKSLEIKLAGAPATTQLPFVLAYVERLTSDQSVSAVGETDGVTNGTTAVVVLSAPAAGYTRQVTDLSVPNVDTAVATLTVQYNNNGTLRRIAAVALAVGDNFVYQD